MISIHQGVIKMTLTLSLKNPSPRKKEFTDEEVEKAFQLFLKKAKIYRDNYKRDKKLSDDDLGGEFHWKDEHYAKIFKSKFNIMQQALSYYCGSDLEIIDETPSMYLVYAEGYWECIGG